MQELLPHQQRVITERVELEDKISKLDSFLKDQQLNGLTISQDDLNLLTVQLGAMKSYSFILQLRINLF